MWTFDAKHSALFFRMIEADQMAPAGPIGTAYNVAARIAPSVALSQALAVSITLLFATQLAQRFASHRAFVFALTGALASISASLVMGGFDLSGVAAGALTGLIAARLLAVPKEPDRDRTRLNHQKH